MSKSSLVCILIALVFSAPGFAQDEVRGTPLTEETPYIPTEADLQRAKNSEIEHYASYIKDWGVELLFQSPPDADFTLLCNRELTREQQRSISRLSKSFRDGIAKLDPETDRRYTHHVNKVKAAH